jgi:hypothetical protein
MQVTTRSDAARRLYRRRAAAYAFNENRPRQFKAALAADLTCAMCAWGVAWQLARTSPGARRFTEARRTSTMRRATPRTQAHGNVC